MLESIFNKVAKIVTPPDDCFCKQADPTNQRFPMFLFGKLFPRLFSFEVVHRWICNQNNNIEHISQNIT